MAATPERGKSGDLAFDMTNTDINNPSSLPEELRSSTLRRSITEEFKKTRMCKLGLTCHYGDKCFFAHCEKELKPRKPSFSSTAASSFRVMNQSSSQYCSAISGRSDDSDTGTAPPRSRQSSVGDDEREIGAPFTPIDQQSANVECITECISGTQQSMGVAVPAVVFPFFPTKWCEVLYMLSYNERAAVEDQLKNSQPLFYSD
jgi:hypothetical protein